MAKSDAPPLKMIVERGPKLTPATAFDAERLDSYPIGRRINVTFVSDGSRVGERKWWAIIGRALKDCATPWKTKDQASEAIKLALGIVNLGKTVNGSWMQWPKSLKELDDDELDEAVRDMMDLLHRVTGVDPAEWSRETAAVGEDEQVRREPPHHTSGEGGGEMASPHDSAPTDPADAADQALPDEAVAHPVDSGSANHSIELMREAIDKFLARATDKTLPNAKERQDVLKVIKNEWKIALPDRLEFVKQCTEKANEVVKGTMTPEAAREYLEALVR